MQKHTQRKPVSKAEPAAAIHQRKAQGFQFTDNRSQSTVQMKPKGDVVQLNEKGKSWGSWIGAGLGATAGYLIGSGTATTNALVGGVVEGAHGLYEGGLKEGLMGAVHGAGMGWLSGSTFGTAMGWKLGSHYGGVVGDWWTGSEKEKKLEVDGIIKAMKRQLPKLKTAKGIHHGLKKHEKEVSSEEVPVINWLYNSLGATNFKKLTEGAQVRVKLDPEVFLGLIHQLGAQKRPSSHYSGTLFASGFRQVLGQQYGTSGTYLPTILFGMIEDRKGEKYMYLQPERNAYNPNTSKEEKEAHKWDAFNYAFKGVQQGPKGESSHTDADPITDQPKYEPTYLDKYGFKRTMDFEAFFANYLYASVGADRLKKITHKVKTKEKVAAHVAALILPAAGGAALMKGIEYAWSVYTAWKG